MRYVHVSPLGGKLWVDAAERDTVNLETALARARPGDLIRLLPGTYSISRPLRLDISGTAEAPIVIRGEPGVVLDGGRSPDPTVSASDPGLGGYAVFQLVEVRHVRIQALAIRNAWPSAIYVRDSHAVRFDHLDIDGGTYAVFAAGVRCRDITVAHSRWLQDRRIWQQIAWADIHDSHTRQAPFRYLNGAFFGAEGIAGAVTLHDNDISHCYNAIRLDVDAALAAAAPPGRYNRDVRIFANRFSFVRDNPIEPEVVAYGWWVHHNRFFNTHKLLSLTGVAGGYWYVFGNLGWFDSRPGPAHDPNNGGAVLKFAQRRNTDRFPTAPFEMFHNSWYLRQQYLKKGTTARLHHRYNVIAYAHPANLPVGMMPATQPFLGTKAELRAEDDVFFQGDVCNHAAAIPAPADGEGFPDALVTRAVYRGGWPVRGRLVRAGLCGDLRPLPGFEHRAAAFDIVLPDGTTTSVPGGQLVGAWNGATPYHGPNFKETALA